MKCTNRRKEAKKKSKRFEGGERRAIAWLTLTVQGCAKVSNLYQLECLGSWRSFQPFFFFFSSLADLRNSAVQAISLSRT